MHWSGRRLCVTGLLALCLCIPGFAQQQNDDPTVVRFSFWGNFRDLALWKEVAHRFEAKNPDIHIKLEYITGEYGQKLPLLMVSNTAADIILMDDEFFPAYAVRGYLEDLSPYVERDKAELHLEEFLPTSMESFTWRDRPYGLPWDGMAVLIYYSKDLFDRAGIPYPTDDWTWDDLRGYAKRLTMDLNGDGRIDQYGFAYAFAFAEVEPIIWTYGGDILNADRSRCLVNSPQAIQGVQLLYDMMWKDHSMARVSEVEALLPETQLLTGKLGMVLSGSYMSLTLEPVKDGLRWGIAPMPKGPGGKRYTRASWDGISINARSPYKEQAWRFIKFLLSEECQALIGESSRGVPIRKPDALKYYVRDDTQADEERVLQAIGYGKLTPITPKYLEIRQVFTEECNRLNLGQATPVEVMNAIVPRVDDILHQEIQKWGADREEHFAPRKTSTEHGIDVFVVAAPFALLLLLSKRVRRAIVNQAEVIGHTLKRRMVRQEAMQGLLFAAPWLIGFCLFTAGPIWFSIKLSFSEWDPIDQLITRSYVGFANYHRAFFEDPLMWKSLWNTVSYAIAVVPLSLCVSLGLALLLNQRIRGIGFFRTAFYIPSIVGGVATVILWTYIFSPQFGPLNGLIRIVNQVLDKSVLLRFLELPEPAWIIDPAWAKPSLIIMVLWGAGGAGMLVFLAGLQGVPKQLYEVADLDGAGRLRKFWSITLPMLTPTIYFNFIMGLIGSFQVFMQAYVLTAGKGGNDNSLLFFVFHLYNKAFVEYDMGYASALAWILFVIILALTLGVVRSSSMWVYYGGEGRN